MLALRTAATLTILAPICQELIQAAIGGGQGALSALAVAEAIAVQALKALGAFAPFAPLRLPVGTRALLAFALTVDIVITFTKQAFTIFLFGISLYAIAQGAIIKFTETTILPLIIRGLHVIVASLALAEAIRESVVLAEAELSQGGLGRLLSRDVVGAVAAPRVTFFAYFELTRWATMRSRLEIVVGELRVCDVLLGP